MAPHLDGMLEFLLFGKDPLPSHRLRQWKRGHDVDGFLAIKPDAAVKGRIPIDQDSRLMAAHGMADGVIHQIQSQALGLDEQSLLQGEQESNPPFGCFGL